MSIFSDLLARHIKDKEIRTFSLAQYCEMDRSNMYKLINGKRNPASEHMVHRMAEFMKLTNSERKEFVEAYQISMIGSDVYYRRKNVQKFLDYFVEQKNFYPSRDLFLPEYKPLQEQAPIFIVDKNELRNAIHMIISLAGKSDGEIKMVLQPENSIVTEAICYTHGGYLIEHIFCLNNSRGREKEGEYNLMALRNIIPLYYQDHCKYTPYFYYDDIIARENMFHLFHSMIVTTDYVLIFSEELKQGVWFSQAEMAKNFKALFEQLKKEAKPIVEQIQNLEDQISFFNATDFGRSKGFEFQQQPCFMPLMPVEFVDKYLVEELPNREEILKAAKDYLRMFQDCKEKESWSWTIMFTKEGVEHFFKTGEYYEIPKEIYRKPDREDKKILIKNLIMACQAGHYKMLRPEASIAKCKINLYTTNKKGYLMFKTAENQMLWLNMGEHGILHAFNDYMAALDEKNFYPVEETLEILREILGQN